MRSTGKYLLQGHHQSQDAAGEDLGADKTRRAVAGDEEQQRERAELLLAQPVLVVLGIVPRSTSSTNRGSTATPPTGTSEAVRRAALCGRRDSNPHGLSATRT